MNLTQNRKWAAFLSAGVFAAGFGAAGFGIAGCGGSSSPVINDPGPLTNYVPTVITRATENSLSDDAKILATRTAADAYVPLATARTIDADLAKIRAAYPAVQNVHARSAFEPKTLLIVVNPSSAFVPKWDASANAPASTSDTELVADDPAINTLISEYDATRTTTAQDTTNGRYYVLRFAAALNMPVVAKAFADRAPIIVSAAPNQIIGDGDNITYTPATAAATGKIYAFSQGYGDCQAGCISHYTHTYSLAADGSISEQITGTPPLTATGPGVVNYW